MGCVHNAPTSADFYFRLIGVMNAPLAAALTYQQSLGGPDMKISLFPDHEEFIRKLVDSGRFKSASDAVTAALYLLEDQEELRKIKMEKLRKAINIGLEQSARGESGPFSAEDIEKRGRERLAARAKEAKSA